jgi:hypothetical protein
MYADTINLFNSAEKQNRTKIDNKKKPINGTMIMTEYKF